VLLLDLNILLEPLVLNELEVLILVLEPQVFDFSMLECLKMQISQLLLLLVSDQLIFLVYFNTFKSVLVVDMLEVCLNPV